MQACPYCDAELNRPTHRHATRTKTSIGRKSPVLELINCPDCGGVIDGYSPH